MKYATLALSVVSFAFSTNIGSAYAADDTEKGLLISEIQSAKPLNRLEPKYPISAARKGQEGWTIVSFIVEKDGSVSSPIVEDSSGNKKFNRESLKALKKWQYQPATQNGEPVQQCNQFVRLDYSLSGNGQGGATRKFVSKYKKITQQIQEKDFTSAKSLMEELKSKPRWNLYEDAWYANLQATYFRAVGDQPQQLVSLNRVISAKKYIPESMRFSALVDAFVINTNVANYADALENFSEIKKFENAEKMLTKLAPYVDEIYALIESDKIIVRPGTIGDDSIWRHKMVRNSFALTALDGELYKLEVRCNNKVFTYKPSEENTWSIPNKWGKCNIYVHGEHNSSFKFVELAETVKA